MMNAWLVPIGGGSHARVYRGLAVLKHLRSMYVQRTSQKRAATPQTFILNSNIHFMTGSKGQ